jgi:coenzyme F420 hydrogenase subunit beta
MGKAWPEEESLESCVFNTGWLGSHEERLFGRRRDSADPDERDFGIARRRFYARMKRPLEGAQWGGIVTSIALRALETGLVDGVLTLHGSMTTPKAVLATTAAEVLEGRGNKPVLSPTLLALHEAWRKGVKRVLAVGAPCHVHALRHAAAHNPRLAGMEFHVVGIPCTDNVEPSKFRSVLNLISRSPETVTSMKFMQDYRVHMKHKGGKVEKLPYFCLPPERSRPEVFPDSCLSCFDYLNGLADLTVGYFGAPFSKGRELQWLLVRTEAGEKLFDLVADRVECLPETRRGDGAASARHALRQMLEPVLHPGEPLPKQLPRPAGELLSLVAALAGPRGIEFARYSVHIHALRNYAFVVRNLPERAGKLVPKHVAELAESCGLQAE